MKKWLLLLGLVVISGCGGANAKVNALMEQELQETNKLYKIFKDVKDEKTWDHAVAAMEQPCTSIAHLRKQIEEQVSTMSPAQMKEYGDSAERKNLNQAQSRMVRAMFDARRLIPARQHEFDDVWRKAGLGVIGGK